MILSAFDVKFHEKKNEIPPRGCRPPYQFANIVPWRGALMARGHTKEKGPHAGGAVLFCNKRCEQDPPISGASNDQTITEAIQASLTHVLSKCVVALTVKCVVALTVKLAHKVHTEAPIIAARGLDSDPKRR